MTLQTISEICKKIISSVFKKHQEFIRYLYVKNTYYYETIQMSAIEAHVNKNIIFVPHWIVEVLKRNSCSLRDILNYDVIRKYVSTDDLSGLLGFQQTPEIGSLKMTAQDSLLSRWEGSATQRNRLELDSGVVPMSYSKEKEVLSRLCKSGFDSFDEKQFIYKVVDIDRDNIVVIMYQGFVEEIKTFNVLKELVTQLLAQCYVYCKVEQVSRFTLFKTYVDLLEVSTLSNNTATR